MAESILQACHDLYARLEKDESYQIAQPGYSSQQVAFRVVLRISGELVEIQDIRQTTEGTQRPQRLLVPGDSKPSGSGLNPCFLWDNQGYMLGYKPDDPKPDRTQESFAEFRKKHLALEEDIDSPEYFAVCRFLEQWNPNNAHQYPLLSEGITGFGVFQIQGRTGYVHETEEVRTWWEANRDDDGAATGQCLVTGRIGSIARIHPKIKGVGGAQSSGAVIVGFNESAYESYGKSQSENAPVSESAAFKYTTALNALLNGPRSGKHRLTLGDATIVFWTETQTVVEDIFAALVSEGSPEDFHDSAQDEGVRQQLESFLKALRAGRSTQTAQELTLETRYYLLSLSPNAARISVRFFHVGTLGDLFDNLRRHLEDIRIVRERGPSSANPDPEFPPLWKLLLQTARESKDIPPLLSGPFLKSVVTGARYPDAVYSAVLRRVHAERRISYLKACLIKAYIVRNMKQEVSMSLDSGRTDPAYLTGRLFAVLEKTQADALGTVNASIRDRFYSSASATPGSVFPRLLRTYQHHLAKLDGGRKINREKLVQEVVAGLDGFPRHLDLNDQGLFAIGYYHQMRDFYTKHDSSDQTNQEQ